MSLTCAGGFTYATCAKRDLHQTWVYALGINSFASASRFFFLEAAVEFRRIGEFIVRLVADLSNSYFEDLSGSFYFFCLKLKLSVVWRS